MNFLYCFIKFSLIPYWVLLWNDIVIAMTGGCEWLRVVTKQALNVGLWLLETSGFKLGFSVWHEKEREISWGASCNRAVSWAAFLHDLNFRFLNPP